MTNLLDAILLLAQFSVSGRRDTKVQRIKWLLAAGHVFARKSNFEAHCAVGALP